MVKVYASRGKWLIDGEWKKLPPTKQQTPIFKPCKTLHFCPYGYLVEEFPLDKIEGINCQVFGHQCPIFYLGEGVYENFDDEKELLKENPNIFNEQPIF